MKKLVLLLTAAVLVISAMAAICSTARGRPILCAMSYDSDGRVYIYDFPDGRVYDLEGEPPYGYTPTQTPKGPIGIPVLPIGPEDLSSPVD